MKWELLRGRQYGKAPLKYKVLQNLVQPLPVLAVPNPSEPCHLHGLWRAPLWGLFSSVLLLHTAAETLPSTARLADSGGQSFTQDTASVAPGAPHLRPWLESLKDGGDSTTGHWDRSRVWPWLGSLACWPGLVASPGSRFPPAW